MKNIQSRDNPTFKQLKKLAESARERRKASRAVLDGVHLLEAALDAGCMPESVVVAEGAAGSAEVAGLLRRLSGVSLAQLADGLFAEISPVESPSGILAVLEIPRLKVAGKPEFCLLLEDIQDPGNLGSILRSAAAAGVQVAYLSTGCVDAWSPKVLRGGMGAHFLLAIEERVDLLATAAAFDGLVVATSLEASQSLYTLDLTQSLALMVGNEGAGLSADLLATAGARIRIPMPGRVESLNAGVAAAICLFERVRQLNQKMGMA